MLRKVSFLVAGILLFAASAFGLTVLQLNLEQLTALAEKVFVGKCLSVESRTDSSGRPVQYVTFEVIEMLKGEPAAKVTFKQLGLSSPQEKDLSEEGITVQGVFREMPRYEAGEEALIFLSAESRLGFTAPVGLYQGKFRIDTDPSGTKSVVNGIGNRGLFIGWRKSPKFKSMTLTGSEKNLLNAGEGELPYPEFISLVKKLVASS
jgi:hypothetical protein